MLPFNTFLHVRLTMTFAACRGPLTRSSQPRSLHCYNICFTAVAGAGSSSVACAFPSCSPSDCHWHSPTSDQRAPSRGCFSAAPPDRSTPHLPLMQSYSLCQSWGYIYDCCSFAPHALRHLHCSVFVSLLHGVVCLSNTQSDNHHKCDKLAWCKLDSVGFTYWLAH